MTRAPDRWPARPALGAVVRCAAIVVPVAIALVVALGLASTLPAATTWPARIGWWAAVLGGSTLALVIADRAARRLLPLAVLLDLALVFPGRAPSRFRAARSSNIRQLEKKLAAMRAFGAIGRPIDAAETLVTLVGIIGLHDKRTRGHSERVRAFTDLLTDELGLNDDARVRVRWASLVHDIGKLSVPRAVLNGGTELGEDGWAALRQHPIEGRRLAAGLMPWLGEWGSAIEQHHERWDGTGYPHGLAGEDIAYGARIVAVADAFDTMTSARTYSQPRSANAAREELARCAGSQFDPSVVRAFLALSLPRLSWVLGPVTWLAQLPFLVAADRAGRSVKAGATAAGVAGLVALGALPGPGGAGPAPSPPVVAGRTAESPGQNPPAALPFTADDPTVSPTGNPRPASPRPPTPAARVAHRASSPTRSTPRTPAPAPGIAPAPVAARAPAAAVPPPRRPVAGPPVAGPPVVGPPVAGPPVVGPPVVSPPVVSPPVVSPPVVSPPVVSPPVVSPPVVTPPVVSPPVVSPPVVAPPPGGPPGPGKVKPGKRKGNGKGNGQGNGKGNGHFGANNASHSGH